MENLDFVKKQIQKSYLQSANVPAYLALPVCIIIAQLPLVTVSISKNVRKCLEIKEKQIIYL